MGRKLLKNIKKEKISCGIFGFYGVDISVSSVLLPRFSPILSRVAPL